MPCFVAAVRCRRIGRHRSGRDGAGWCLVRSDRPRRCSIRSAFDDLLCGIADRVRVILEYDAVTEVKFIPGPHHSARAVRRSTSQGPPRCYAESTQDPSHWRLSSSQFLNPSHEGNFGSRRSRYRGKTEVKGPERGPLFVQERCPWRKPCWTVFMSWICDRALRREALVRLDSKVQKDVRMTSLDVLVQSRVACLVLGFFGSLLLSLSLLIRFFGSLLLLLSLLLRFFSSLLLPFGSLLLPFGSLLLRSARCCSRSARCCSRCRCCSASSARCCSCCRCCSLLRLAAALAVAAAPLLRLAAARAACCCASLSCCCRCSSCCCVSMLDIRFNLGRFRVIVKI